MANLDLDERSQMKFEGSPMKHGGGKIELNSPSDEEGSI
jgi:hypothetical protein